MKMKMSQKSATKIYVKSMCFQPNSIFSLPGIGDFGNLARIEFDEYKNLNECLMS